MNTGFNLRGLHPLSWIRAFWKQKFLVLLLTVAGSGVWAAFVFWLPPVYRADVLILVENQRIPERFVSSTVSQELSARLSALTQQVTSYTSLLKIISKYDLYGEERRSKAEEEIVDLMRSHIKVQLEPGLGKEQSTAFRVSYEARDPRVAAQVANELATQLIEQNLRSREVYARGTSEFLSSQVEEARRRLQEQEALLAEFKRRYAGELPQQEPMLSSALARLQLQLQSIQDEMNRTQQTKVLRESELNAALHSQAALEQMSRQIATETAQGERERTEREIKQLEQRLAALRARYTDNHPDVRDTRQTLERLRASLTGPGSSSGGDTGKPAPAMEGSLIRERERVAQMRAQLLVLDEHLSNLEANRKKVLAEIERLQQRLSQLPAREQELAALARDYEIQKANYQSLLNKKMAAEVAAEMEDSQKAERFVILDPARVPERPLKPNRQAWLLGGWAGVLVLSVLVGLAVELRKNVLLGEWELPEGVPVLARVPKIVIGEIQEDAAAKSDGSARRFQDALWLRGG